MTIRGFAVFTWGTRRECSRKPAYFSIGTSFVLVRTPFPAAWYRTPGSLPARRPPRSPGFPARRSACRCAEIPLLRRGPRLFPQGWRHSFLRVSCFKEISLLECRPDAVAQAHLGGPPPECRPLHGIGRMDFPFSMSSCRRSYFSFTSSYSGSASSSRQSP